MKWTHIRIPAELKARLERAAQRELDGYAAGNIWELPDEYCDRVPVHYIIKRALDELEDKRRRSNRRLRKPECQSPSPIEQTPSVQPSIV